VVTTGVVIGLSIGLVTTGEVTAGLPEEELLPEGEPSDEVILYNTPLKNQIRKNNL
jgi:hypothetical protein